MIPRVARRRQ